MKVDFLIQAVKYNVTLNTVIHADDSRVISFMNLYNDCEQQIGVAAIDHEGEVYWAMAWLRRAEKETTEEYYYDGLYWKHGEYADMFANIENSLGRGFTQAVKTEKLEDIQKLLVQGYELDFFPEEDRHDFSFNLGLNEEQMSKLSILAYENNLTHLDTAQVLLETALVDAFDEPVDAVELEENEI